MLSLKQKTLKEKWIDGADGHISFSFVAECPICCITFNATDLDQSYVVKQVKAHMRDDHTYNEIKSLLHR